jgi:hypothetical protein
VPTHKHPPRVFSYSGRYHTHTHTPSIIEIDLGQLERREKELSVKQMLQETEHKLVELKHMEDKVHPRHTYPVIPKHT